MTDHSPDEILSPRDVARWLKTSRSWPYTMVARGLLPHFKLNKLIRFRRGDIEAVLERSRVK